MTIQGQIQLFLIFGEAHTEKHVENERINIPFEVEL